MTVFATIYRVESRSHEQKVNGSSHQNACKRGLF
jgi:hypothetical protein